MVILVVPCLGQIAAADAPAGKLRVVGNKVITDSGQRYTPEGISVYGGLEAVRYNANAANDYAQIKAARTYWHANTIRLQVSENNLFTHLKHGQTYNPDFFSALNKQVSYARGLGMAVVINDQTEFTGNSPSPTARTARFWQLLARKFKSQPSVIFDIFNEPRLTSVVDTDQLATGIPYSPIVTTKLMSARPSSSAMTLTRH